MTVSLTQFSCRRCLFPISKIFHRITFRTISDGQKVPDILLDDNPVKDVSTNIARLDSRLHRRLKNLPPVWELPSNKNRQAAMDFSKSDAEIMKKKDRIDRKIFAKFGRAAAPELDPSVLWPSAEEIAVRLQ